MVVTDKEDGDVLPIKPPSYDKELSWLSFNARVLQEAGNPEVPLIQRVRYLGVYSNNLDEFFRVRVADVSRLAAFSKKTEIKLQFRELLIRIQDESRKLQRVYDKIYKSVLSDLAQRKIYIVHEGQLDGHQSRNVSDIFKRRVLPQLDPVIIDGPGQFPEVTDGCIYLAVKLTEMDEAVRYAIVDVPTDRLPRFFNIPQRVEQKGCTVFIVLENIIRHNLKEVFRGLFDIKKVEAYQFTITRDAELELGDGIDQTLADRIASSLKKRKNADLERFIFDSEMPSDLLQFLKKELKLTKYDSEMPGGRYHNAKDFISFPSVGRAYLQFPKMPALPCPTLNDESSNIFESIRSKDILLYYPYHSFDTVVDFLKTAAIDPAVKSISICLYRAASKSMIVDALISAKNNRKKVTVVVELQARFDEAANITWARELTTAGVNVIYGVPGLKVHSKLIQVRRKEGQSLKYYTHIGTGNFNEKTATLYTDFSLLSYNQKIGGEIAQVFDFISYNYRYHRYDLLMVSPHSNRKGLVRLIQRELDNAKAGKPAQVSIKCNNLVDDMVIAALSDASNAGVRIRIICRGMFSMVVGKTGYSENVEAISIVDRFLEHPRFLIFHNDDKPEYYISSADLMARNLDFRVEVTAPVLDDDHKKTIQDIFDIQWCDNVKARLLDPGQTNAFRKRVGGEKIRSQEVIYRYLKGGKVPTAVVRAKKRWQVELLCMARSNQKKAILAHSSTD